jgi:hypothetical protein
MDPDLGSPKTCGSRSRSGFPTLASSTVHAAHSSITITAEIRRIYISNWEMETFLGNIYSLK